MKKIIFICLLVFTTTTIFAQQVQMNYKELYKQVSPGVVLLFGVSGKVGSSGTGSIITKDGIVVTNAHVVINPATHKPFDQLFVFIKPEKVTGKNANDLKNRYQATVVEYDEDMDLAVVKMSNPPKDMTIITIADSSEISIGEATAAIGHPEQGSRWSLTTGAISAEIDDFNGIEGKHVFQMETAVNRGNSGGPLLDYRGYMVGINSMIARESKDGLAIVGINFAIKANSVVEWMAKKGVYVSVAKADGSEAQAVVAKKEETKAEVKTEENKTTEIAVKTDNKATEVKKDTKDNGKTNKTDLKVASKNDKKDVKLEVKIEENKHKTEEISNTVTIVVKEKSTKTYKVRPKNVKIVTDAKPGKVMTESEVLLERSKKAHDKMDKKLGGWDEEPF